MACRHRLTSKITPVLRPCLALRFSRYQCGSFATLPTARHRSDARTLPEPVAPTSGLPKEESVGNKRFAEFDLAGKTYVVTGGARGLGLALAEALVEAGGKGS